MKNNKLIYFFGVLVALYLLIAVLLFVFQRGFIYLPSGVYQHDFEQITLQTEDVEIEIIVLNRGHESAFIYFGGNAEAVVFNALDFIRQFPNQTIYLVNYRGYGGSTGKPTQAGLLSDASAIFDMFAPAHKYLAVVGRSLGSGIAMHVAAHRSVSQAVLITPYDSLVAIAKKQYPMFPISLMLKDPYDSIALAEKVSAPVLILIGGKDRLIPLQHSQNLFEALGPDTAKMVVIEQAGHNNISQFPAFYTNMMRFFNYHN